MIQFQSLDVTIFVVLQLNAKIRLTSADELTVLLKTEKLVYFYLQFYCQLLFSGVLAQILLKFCCKIRLKDLQLLSAFFSLLNLTFKK